MRITLSRDFEDQLKADVLDQLEGDLPEQLGEAIEQSHDRLRDFGSQYDYNIDPIIESLQEPEIRRERDGITAEWGYEHEAAPYFEFGTSDHTINGNPILSFVWEDPPEWVTEEFEAEGDGYRVFFRSVEVTGVKETRFVRAGLQWLERNLS